MVALLANRRAFFRWKSATYFDSFDLFGRVRQPFHSLYKEMYSVARFKKRDKRVAST